jgi:hypothetical protein
MYRKLEMGRLLSVCVCHDYIAVSNGKNCKITRLYPVTVRSKHTRIISCISVKVGHFSVLVLLVMTCGWRRYDGEGGSVAGLVLTFNYYY